MGKSKYNKCILKNNEKVIEKTRPAHVLGGVV